jgi:hypothetical protein
MCQSCFGFSPATNGASRSSRFSTIGSLRPVSLRVVMARV